MLDQLRSQLVCHLSFYRRSHWYYWLCQFCCWFFFLFYLWLRFLRCRFLRHLLRRFRLLRLLLNLFWRCLLFIIGFISGFDWLLGLLLFSVGCCYLGLDFFWSFWYFLNSWNRWLASCLFFICGLFLILLSLLLLLWLRFLNRWLRLLLRISRFWLFWTLLGSLCLRNWLFDYWLLVLAWLLLVRRLLLELVWFRAWWLVLEWFRGYLGGLLLLVFFFLLGNYFLILGICCCRRSRSKPWTRWLPLRLFLDCWGLLLSLWRICSQLFSLFWSCRFVFNLLWAWLFFTKPRGWSISFGLFVNWRFFLRNFGFGLFFSTWLVVCCYVWILFWTCRFFLNLLSRCFVLLNLLWGDWLFSLIFGCIRLILDRLCRGWFLLSFKWLLLLAESGFVILCWFSGWCSLLIICQFSIRCCLAITFIVITAIISTFLLVFIIIVLVAAGNGNAPMIIGNVPRMRYFLLAVCLFSGNRFFLWWF